MSNIRPPKPVKLFVGLISNEITLMGKVREILARHFGPLDYESDILEFKFTTYYNNELGENLKRRFLCFRRLIVAENGYKIKVLTNKIEKKFSAQGKRRINIDPGYLSLSKLILFTTKNFYHRIYLGKGIYAEVTLYYRDKTFQPFEWSYPDYRSDEYLKFFNGVREHYAAQFAGALPAAKETPMKQIEAALKH